MGRGILTAIVFFLFQIQNSFAGMGGADGAGGDTDLSSDVMWFVSDSISEVKVCAEIDAKFGLSVSDARTVFDAAAKTWSQYHAETRGGDLIPFRWISKCDGSEDLTLYLGGTNRKVQEASKAFSAPMGFVHRESYDVKKGWGKGFIWVARPGEKLGEDVVTPDWKTPHALQALLTHELGHVLGCTHQSGTVMDAGLPRALGNAGYTKLFSRLAGINHSKELLPRRDGVTEYDGAVERTNILPKGNHDQTVFALFAGQLPGGESSAQVKLHRSSTSLVKVELTLSDSYGSYLVPITLGQRISSLRFGRVFGTAHMGKMQQRDGSGRLIAEHEIMTWGSLSSSGEVYAGTARSAKGDEIRIILEVNADGADPVRIRYETRTGTFKPLFTTSNFTWWVL